MLNVPAAYWNRMATESKMKTLWGKTFFSMDQDQMTEAMDKEMDKLEQSGVSNQVALAFVLAAPMVAEPEAIRVFAQKNPGIREALPEVNNLNEAAEIAAMEYRLKQTQKEVLRMLLEKNPMLKAI